MTSKQLAQVLLRPIRSKFKGGDGGYVKVNYLELDELESNIELFLLRQFEEGRHVGRDHDSIVDNVSKEFENEKV
jgi:hypothetical protein